MTKIGYYEINVNSSAGNLMSVETNNTHVTFLLPEHLEGFNFKITIVVYNREGMSSQSTSRSYGMKMHTHAATYLTDCIYVVVSYI